MTVKPAKVQRLTSADWGCRQLIKSRRLLLIVRSAGGTHMSQITQETFRVLQVVLKIVLKDTPEKGEKCAHMHTIKQNKKFPLLVNNMFITLVFDKILPTRQLLSLR